MNSTCTFTPDSIAVFGRVFPARYTVTPDGTVFASVTAPEGDRAVPLRIQISTDHPDHASALAAAQPAPVDRFAPIEQQPAPDQQQPEPIEEQTAPIEQQTDPVEQQTEPNQERSPKEARGPVPEKTFAGTEIKGRGWMIEFSTLYDRTRVIFEKVPSAAVRETVKAAGFHWSPSMKSWNKHLTFRAYRAAKALAVQLNALCS